MSKKRYDDDDSRREDRFRDSDWNHSRRIDQSNWEEDGDWDDMDPDQN